MADFKALISGLRRAEQHFEKQLAGIRAAISSLEMGSAASPAAPALDGGDGTRKAVRKRRRMSAAARKRISAAQKKRWAAQRAKDK